MPRKTCDACLRPQSVCYCTALVKVANTIKVLIIQHPLEGKHPFNTGRMAHLCLSNSEMIIAEKLSGSELDTLLDTPSALLYPSLGWLPDNIDLDIDSFISDSDNNQQPVITQLIVIDATWKKSKKILHLNPQLQTLPRVNLSGGLKSNYTIRKTSISNGLSTIESIVQAMQLLEQKTDFQRLLKPFERMIALQKLSYLN
ncbi:tRNA-uridine aminocarboxypropyltransferase [Microbulbifer variabilis]|uniref:tRNA-uridine aminocarboxypropyltransferase n=1 Tax=Microbulbifer variabilis TaxID=266805 RepID=UPI00037DEDC8|nr:tRNA-uridine aminocarboxypropyltransferase [Microbulbifer variabilis]